MLPQVLGMLECSESCQSLLPTCEPWPGLGQLQTSCVHVCPGNKPCSCVSGGQAVPAGGQALPGPRPTADKHHGVQDLAISGCAGATDELFASVNQSGRAVQLHTLSAKHLKGLQACWLGLQPLDASQALPDSARASWHPAASAFSGVEWL